MRINTFKYMSVVTAGLLALTGCNSDPKEASITPTRHFTNAPLKAYADQELAIYDPAESTNKEIYKFNAELDKYFFIPVVNGYVYITPTFVRTGVTNFFQNIGEVNNFVNSTLQASPKKATITLFRFTVNTTAGLLGTFDVATKIGLVRQPEDFGKTLGHWGVGSGPYIMLPVLGPSNARDTLGKIVDYATIYFIIPEHIQDSVPYDVAAYGLQPVDLRYTNSFRYYDSGSPFEYEFVRYIYTNLRTSQIETEKHESSKSSPGTSLLIPPVKNVPLDSPAVTSTSMPDAVANKSSAPSNPGITNAPLFNPPQSNPSLSKPL